MFAVADGGDERHSLPNHRLFRRHTETVVVLVSLPLTRSTRNLFSMTHVGLFEESHPLWATRVDIYECNEVDLLRLSNNIVTGVRTFPAAHLV